jgi:hypothetical protein
MCGGVSPSELQQYRSCGRSCGTEVSCPKILQNVLAMVRVMCQVVVRHMDVTNVTALSLYWYR